MKESKRVWLPVSILIFLGAFTFPATVANSVSASGDVVRPPDIIFIVIDTLRADYLGAYGFLGPVSPHLDRFADDSVRFRRCVSAAPWTKPSIASMLTSLLPGTHRVLDHEGQYALDVPSGLKTGALPEDAETLAEILRDGGYRTAGWSANAWITSELGFAQGFEEFHGPGRNLLNSEEILKPALDWLNRTTDSGPVFLYLHLMDVHGPWRRNPSEWSLLRLSPSLGWDRLLSDQEITKGKDLVRLMGGGRPRSSLGDWRGAYAAGVRVMDRRLGEFLESLRTSGRFDQSLVVITADHGEELLDHDGWGHGWTLHSDQTWVPLMVHLPGSTVRGRVNESIVSTLDFAPTLLEAAGLSRSHGMQGTSFWSHLIEGVDQGPPRWVVAQGVKGNQKLVSIEDGRMKLIWEYPDGAIGLFDQRRDPSEHRNLAYELPELRRSLEQEVIVWMNRIQTQPSLLVTTAELSEDDASALRSLGYLDGH